MSQSQAAFTRRALLRAGFDRLLLAGTAGAAAVMTTAVAARPAIAAGALEYGADNVGARQRTLVSNDEPDPTDPANAYALVGLANNDGVGVVGQSAGLGVGVLGFAGVGSPPVGPNAFSGVLGYASGGTGVFGMSMATSGVHGQSEEGPGGSFQSEIGDGVQAWSRNGGNGVWAQATAGDGVQGRSEAAGSGVHGISQDGWGVYGESTREAAVRGVSTEGVGGYGQSAANDGLLGVALMDGRGVRGESAHGAGLHGFSGPYQDPRPGMDAVGVLGEAPAGRGGIFSGGVAAVRLVPGTAAGAPALGERGDLVVDANGHLWFCRGDVDWVQLA